jgi:nucleoside-diphosphate-sugar epimerase
VFGDGSQELSAIHAEDLARALVAVATSPAAQNRLYFATHPAPTTSRDVVRACGRALGTTPRIVPVPSFVARGVLWTVGSLAHLAGRATLLSANKADEYLAPAWTCRGDALTRDTGWRAEIDLEPGLRRTAAWYRDMGWL